MEQQKGELIPNGVLERKPGDPSLDSNKGVPVNFVNVGVSEQAETSTQTYSWKTSGGM